MRGEYKVETLNVKLESYDYLFSKFKNWIQFKRDIKITSVLESKRIQYDLDSIVNLFGYFGGEKENHPAIHGYTLQDVCFSIKSMSFIINNEIVEDLKITIETSNNRMGRILESMIISESNVFIKQFMDKRLDSEYDEVLFFYVDDNRIYEPIHKAA